jgi:membrane-associated PAP2 superfamily phosphatase
LFQIIINPPEAPTEGMKTYSSKRLGQQALIKARSKFSFFVSYKQMTEQPLLLIAFISANCFDLALRPLMFQHKTNHFLRKFITIKRDTNNT